MKVLDADGHIVETAEELRAFMDPPYQDTAFDIVTDSRGNGFFLVEGRMIPKPAGKGCGTPRGFGGIGPQGRYGTARVGFDKDRLRRDLDREGIDLHVIYPTFLLGVCGIEDKDKAAALCRGYNNWMAEIRKELPGRVDAVAVVPLQDPEAAVAELRRAREELNLCGVTIPAVVFDKNLDDEDFLPFFAEAERLDTAVAVHSVTGAYPTIGADRYDRFFFTHTLAMSFPTMAAMLSLICQEREYLRELRARREDAAGLRPPSGGGLPHVRLRLPPWRQQVPRDRTPAQEPRGRSAVGQGEDPRQERRPLLRLAARMIPPLGGVN